MIIDLATILALLKQHAWLAAGVIIVGLIVRMLKSDAKFPINIPTRWLPVATLVLSQAYTTLEAIQSGTPWKTAVWTGLTLAMTTMGLFDLVIKAVLNGKDMPAWLGWLLKELPVAPPQPAPDASDAPKPPDGQAGGPSAS